MGNKSEQVTRPALLVSRERAKRESRLLLLRSEDLTVDEATFNKDSSDIDIKRDQRETSG